MGRYWRDVVGSRGGKMWWTAEVIGCGRQPRWEDVVGAEVVGCDGQQGREDVVGSRGGRM